MFGQIYNEICWNIYKSFLIMPTLQDFTDNLA